MEVPRHTDGRPYVIPPGESKPVLYSRASKLASILDDGYGLDLWHQRMVATGIADNEWLLDRIRENRNDVKELNALCDVAREKAGASQKASWGTIVHYFTECIDAGYEPIEMPGPTFEAAEREATKLGMPLRYLLTEAEADLNAYEYAMRDMSTIASEQFVVCDEIRSGGSPDKIVHYAGSNYIWDLKTGTLAHNGLKFAIQLAIYSRSVFYGLNDSGGPWRRALPDVRTDKAILLHLPRLQGEATLYWVDIQAGWEALQLGLEVRAWRNRKDLVSVLNTEPPALITLPDTLSAATVSELRAFARAEEINLSGATRKADIVAAIYAAAEARSREIERFEATVPDTQ